MYRNLHIFVYLNETFSTATEIIPRMHRSWLPKLFGYDITLLLTLREASG